GINLLDIFIENDDVIVLDTLLLEDEPGSIYNIPSHELGGMGLNSGGAHEVGVLQCLDMIALLDKEPPNSNIIGIIPQEITFEMNLSDTLKEKFDHFIAAALNELKSKGVNAERNKNNTTLTTIIERVKDPSFNS
ncbi:MAG: hydrogenase maturation protease, partial [Sulfurimonadaceae bacterium]|nr:hydrogenase maturation protease [Sulfurimonadaceae bacterium]